MNLPLLRFPEFEGKWEEKRICDFGHFYYGKSAPKFSLSDDAPTPCVRYGELYSTFSEVITEVRSFTNINPKQLKFSKGGEILVPRVGEDPLDFSQCSLLTLPNVAIGEMISVFNTKQNGLFVTYLFRTQKYQFAKMVEGGSVSNLYFRYLEPILVSLPSLPEQKKIAAFLGVVDAKVAALRKRVALLERYKRGLMQALFSQALRFTKPDGTAFPDWEEKRLGDVCSFQKGKGIAKADIVENGLQPCIRYGELYTRYSEIIPTACSKTNVPVAQLILSELNDVIIPASGEDRLDMARACCVKESGIALGGDLNILRGKVNGEFLAYYLSNAKRREIARFAQGNSVVHLYGTQLKILDVAIPHPDEQAKIAEALSAMDAKIAAVKAQFDRMQDFKKGLSQQLFV